MTQSIWRGPAVLLALYAVAVAGVADAQVIGGGQNKNQSAQNTNQSQNTNQAQPNARQDRIQGQAERSNATQNASTNAGVQRTNANANVNGQASAEGRAGSGPQLQRSGANVRSARREDRAQRRTAMRPNDMRGPDIGLWFNRGNRDGLVISDVSNRGPIQSSVSVRGTGSFRSMDDALPANRSLLSI